MYPVNLVFLGNDPLLSNSNSFSNMQNIDEQLKLLENQKLILENAQLRMQSQTQVNKIWNLIDQEISPLTQQQKAMMFQDEEYTDIYNLLLTLVQSELLNLVKTKIENSKEGNDLLTKLLKLVKKLKSNIIDSTNKEMELFKLFKEFSKNNPNITYEEFIKKNK